MLIQCFSINDKLWSEGQWNWANQQHFSRDAERARGEYRKLWRCHHPREIKLCSYSLGGKSCRKFSTEAFPEGKCPDLPVSVQVTIALLFGLKFFHITSFPVAFTGWRHKISNHSCHFCCVPCIHLRHCYWIEIACWEHSKVCVSELQRTRQLTGQLFNCCLLLLKQ